MGEVFAAENIRTGRPVAVKLLRAEAKQKASAIARFRREARAAGSINSDHVTEILDVEDDPEHGIVLVFELLEGESLIDRLKRTGPIPFEELFYIIEQTWVGLADAHRAGIVHRDLKPSNVFLEKRPDGTIRVKILDFGISKLPKEMGGETLTEMGQSLGTFSFMPPEQIGKAKTVDHRADIYAATTMIYQSLSAQLPYIAKNILALVELKNKSEPRSLREAMGEPVDPRLEAFISQGLARDPNRRFQSAIEALAAWRDLRPTPVSSSRPHPSMHGTSVMQPYSSDVMARSGEVPMSRSGEVPMARSGEVPLSRVSDSSGRPMPVVPVLSDPVSVDEPVIRRRTSTVPILTESTSDGDAATLAMPLSRIGSGELSSDPRVREEWSGSRPAGSHRLNKTTPMQLVQPPSSSPSPSMHEGLPPRRDDSGMYSVAQLAQQQQLQQHPQQGMQPHGPPSMGYGAPSSRVHGGTARIDTQAPAPRELQTGSQDRTQLYQGNNRQQQPPQIGAQLSTGSLARASMIAARPDLPQRRQSPWPLILAAIAFAIVGFFGVAFLLQYIAWP